MRRIFIVVAWNSKNFASCSVSLQLLTFLNWNINFTTQFRAVHQSNPNLFICPQLATFQDCLNWIHPHSQSIFPMSIIITCSSDCKALQIPFKCSSVQFVAVLTFLACMERNLRKPQNVRGVQEMSCGWGNVLGLILFLGI